MAAGPTGRQVVQAERAVANAIANRVPNASKSAQSAGSAIASKIGSRPAPLTIREVADVAPAVFGSIGEQRDHDLFEGAAEHDASLVSTKMAKVAETTDTLLTPIKAPQQMVTNMWNLSLGTVVAGAGMGIGSWTSNAVGAGIKRPMDFAGNLIQKGGEAIQNKTTSSTLASVGQGVTKGGEFMSSGAVAAQNGMGKVAGAFQGGQHAMAGARKLTQDMSTHMQSHTMKDGIANIPSQALGALKDQADHFGRDGISEKLGNAAEKMAQKEAGFAARAGEMIKGAGKKVTSVVGNVAGDGAAEKLGNAGEKFANANMYKTALKGAAVSTIVVGEMRNISRISKAVEDVVHLYADMKGINARDVSPFKAFSDPDVPACVSKARNNIVRTVGPTVAISALTDVLTWKMYSSMGGGLGSIGAMIGGQMAASALKEAVSPHDPAMEVYSDAREEFKQVGEMSVGSAMKLLKTFSPSLRDTKSKIFLEKLADHYVEQGLQPGELMNKIATGEVAAVGFKIEEEMKASRMGARKAAEEAMLRERAQQQVNSQANPDTQAAHTQYEGPVVQQQMQMAGGV